MDPKRVNEFLPPASSATASPADRMDTTANPMEDDFDVAQYRALKKDKQEEQKRLDHEHDHRHRQLEEQVHLENNRLYSQLQQRVNESIQRAFIDLQPAIATTINNQVSLRLEQQRLRDEHAASKTTIEQRYHNKITSLMAMPSAARSAIPRVNSNSNTPSHPQPNPIRMANTGQGTPVTPAFANTSPAHQSVNTPTPASRGPAPQDATRSEPMAHQAQQRMPPRAEVPPHHHQQPVAPQRILPSEPLTRQPVGPQRMPLPESMAQQPVIQQRMPAEPVHQRPLPHHHVPAEHHPHEPPRHQLPSVAQPLASDTKLPEGPLRQDVPPLPSSNPVLTSRASQGATPTPRQDVKRKAADSPATEAATSAMKRPRTRDRPFEQGQDGPSPLKRSPRAHRPPPAPVVGMEKRVQRTISFAEVYQDGKAQFKHQIFEYKTGSGNWYIVKCDEHGVHFKFGNPVHGAAKHVHSPQHDMQPKTHDLAIEICGYLVTDCNAELAKLNNDEYQRAVAEDGYEPYNRNLLTKEGRQRTDNHKKQPKTEREGGEIHVNGDLTSSKPHKVREQKPAASITVPKDCHFYQGLWQSNKKWYSLVVLPIRPDGSLREVGLKERFQELPLMQTVPKCYRVDRVSLQIKGWQPAYEDGEAKAKKREYPVMFFDRTPWSLGWLPAQKLQELDLDNPPENVDISGLRKAREWFAVKMNNRASWDELKRLGPGEPLSATPEGEADWIDKPDDKSPTFFDKQFGKSPGRRDSPGSGDDSDSEEEEDPMKMDIGPIPDPGAGDSNWVEGGSGSDTHESDVEMEDDTPVKKSDEDSPKIASVETAVARTGETKPSEEPTNGHPDQAGLSNILSEHERVRKSAQTAQAKAAAAVREAASRSRAASEVADEGPKPSAPTETKPTAPARADTDAAVPRPQRPALADHQRSRSDGTFPESQQTGLAAPGMGKLGDGGGRKHSNLQNILNPAGMRSDAAPATENGIDSYKRFDALMAQMSGGGGDTAPLRPASVPVQTNGHGHHFQPPAQQHAKQMEAALPQHSPSLSHILSPPMQSPMMGPPRSASTTPVPDGSGRSTPTIMIPGNNADRWQAVRTSSFGPAPHTPRASFTQQQGHDGQKPPPAPQQQQPAAAPSSSTPTARAETPGAGPDRKEIFDVSQFRDSGRGVRWSRSSSPTAGYLRLATDPVRGVAEPLETSAAEAAAAVPSAGIEPAKVSRIELETERDRQWVQLVLKDRSEQAVAFETNSASGRLLNAKIQGRRFVSWVRKWNPEAEVGSSG
ncbi:hypothetical protein INS49_009484 [Diaporthe citri]|uniref:uncharacterized protein n=1 Tax=Diaporthe citri TaxID=83186 RepID=UPI001C825A42|nr:uncharacterized protein INS49_009484 [Diaporthe citri]KAG6361260.1 hypothetical protein INS49_009484 [Diaporthe citri]